jgi:hypothetical protein|tara:strand:+ start:1853 stop:2077 length:225 start_codon:yes stop_codon:yes gene_type:complete
MAKKLYTKAELDKAVKSAVSKMKKGGVVKKKKRPMNAYMKAVNKARKSGANSFVYNGTTYKAKKMKTGMIVYAK